MRRHADAASAMPAELEVFNPTGWSGFDAWCDARVEWMVAHGAGLDDLRAEIDHQITVDPDPPTDQRLLEAVPL